MTAAFLPPDDPTGTEARVCADIAARQALGIRKYGVTVEGNPLSLREWLNHAYQECLDQAVYLRRAIEEMEAKQTPSEGGILCHPEFQESAARLYADWKATNGRNQQTTASDSQ